MNSLDEPFEIADFEIEDAVDDIDFQAAKARIERMMCPVTPTAFTPLGFEIVFDNECEDKTVIYPPEPVPAVPSSPLDATVPKPPEPASDCGSWSDDEECEI